MATLGALDLVQPLLQGKHTTAVSLLALRSREIDDDLARVGLAAAALNDAPEPATLGEAIGHALAGAAHARRTGELFRLRTAHRAHVTRFAVGVLVAAMWRPHVQSTLSELCESA